MMFDVAVAGVGVAAGAIASIAGFGIGSLLTPLLALRLGTKVAVAAVAVPHVAGTALRLWRVRTHVDVRSNGDGDRADRGRGPCSRLRGDAGTGDGRRLAGHRDRNRRRARRHARGSAPSVTDRRDDVPVP